ncbi:MAG: Na+/H+ antiporter NhaA, partial [Acidimicrobiales bacterium]|nr:Na+/H+ antiporter NhaA [Acidimicrobiales bacterium]
PMATDIAFVLGVVALLGRRVPSGLRLFLLTAAVVDDLGAILVIAIFYTDRLAVAWLLAAVGVFTGVLVLRRRALWSAGPNGIGHVPFVLLGVGLWYCLLRSGVHPTIAGVAMGLAAPARPPSEHRPSVVERVEHLVGPWSSFLVLPLFALANAAVPLDGALDHAGSPVAIGVVVGLVVGKAIGVGGGAWLARRTGIGALPAGVTSTHLVGGALLTGIGFTVSLFVTELAFTDPALIQEAKVGILVASTLAAFSGSAFLATVHTRRS